MTDKASITLVVPAFNEEVNIQKGVLDKIGNYTHLDNRFIEVIIVDDGSSDNTKALIETEYLHRYPKFKLMKNKHAGKAKAVMTGIQEAKADAVMFTDIDLATPIEDSEKLIKELDRGYDVVIGSRNTHRAGAPLLRKVMAIGFIYIRNFLVGLNDIRDTQCGFKVFKRQQAVTIINKLQVFKNQETISGSSVKAGFDLEFLFLANKLGYKIKETQVSWKHVETKNVNFIKDSVETMKDILKIKYYDIYKKYD